MKAFVKKYKEIRKVSVLHCGGRIYANKESGIAFIPSMKEFCEKGPFDFVSHNACGAKDYFRGSMGYLWHKSWLIIALKNKQYLLEF